MTVYGTAEWRDLIEHEWNDSQRRLDAYAPLVVALQRVALLAPEPYCSEARTVLRDVGELRH